MIVKTMSELLQGVIEFEKKRIEEFEFKIEHCPTIGEQYEGIMLKGLNNLFSRDSNLKVVSGFIRNNQNTLSPQVDCMIVQGNGKKIPNSNGKFVYPLAQVIAIFEIKKNLFTSELEDSYSHLYSFIAPDFDDYHRDLTSHEIHFFNNSYAKITGKKVTCYDEGRHQDNPFMEQLYCGLLNNFASPLRIVFGYEGFCDEKSLRQKYIDFLGEKIQKKGFGPFSYPDMIICGDSCLFRLNADPYISHVVDSSFLFYASSSKYNIQILSEIIYSRLSHKYAFDFSGDNQQEPIHPFLVTSFHEEGEKQGWTIKIVPFKDQWQSEAKLWEPQIVSEKAYTLFNLLCSGEPVKRKDISDANASDIIKEVLNTTMVALRDDELFLTTRRLCCCIMPDGTFVVGDDAEGYFSRWLKNYMQKNKKK